MVKTAKDIDSYLSEVPEQLRRSLEKLRIAIREAAPSSIEKISYRIPTFDYKGPLVAFSASAKQRVSMKHVSFHLMSPNLMKTFMEELGPYETTTATIHFPPDQALPVDLIKRLVQARIEENERRFQEKQRRKSGN
jgi:uncharacterized protein YdhG (YjbR/CyaY superfamily)